MNEWSQEMWKKPSNMWPHENVALLPKGILYPAVPEAHVPGP